VIIKLKAETIQNHRKRIDQDKTIIWYESLFPQRLIVIDSDVQPIFSWMNVF